MTSNSAVDFANKIAGAEMRKDQNSASFRNFTYAVLTSDGKRRVTNLSSALAIAKAVDSGLLAAKMATSLTETITLATRHVISVETGMAAPGTVKETQVGNVKFSDGSELNATNESIALAITALTDGDAAVELVTVGSKKVVAAVAQIVSAAFAAA